jgi:L-rhamnose-H+ transport protein
MQVISGLIYHLIGGISSGSFYMPYKKVKNWAWENYWLVGGLFSWLIIPFLAAWLTIPNFMDIIKQADSGTFKFTYLMGLMWGIGGLTYGLGVRYLGMSLGNSIVLGFCSAFGALVPAVYYNFSPTEGKTSLSDMMQTDGGRLVLLGVIVCLIGIAICGKAGIKKEAELGSKAGDEEFSLMKGLVIAIVSGILSSFFNFGIEAGKPMAAKAVEAGCNPLFQNNVSYIVILWGGLTINFIWCIYLHFKNKTTTKYLDKSAPFVKNLLYSALAGTMWFLQFFFYGMGESKLGNGASSWILHMATIILTANLWGLALNEWSAVSTSTKKTFITGLAFILLSIVIVGIGNGIG